MPQKKKSFEKCYCDELLTLVQDLLISLIAIIAVKYIQIMENNLVTKLTKIPKYN